MIDIIQYERSALEALCRRYHVRRLAVFGSAAVGSFDPASSDVDFAVEFEPLDPSQHKESYFGLLLALEDLLGHPVDLVEYGPVRNPYFLRALLDSQVMLYEDA